MVVALFNKTIWDSPLGSYSWKEQMCNQFQSYRTDGLIKHSVSFGDRTISKERCETVRYRKGERVHEIREKPLRIFRGMGDLFVS